MSSIRWSSKRVLGMLGLVLAALAGIVQEHLGVNLPPELIEQLNQWAELLFYGGVGHAIAKNGKG